MANNYNQIAIRTTLQAVKSHINYMEAFMVRFFSSKLQPIIDFIY
jgi:hypothetical protein